MVKPAALLLFEASPWLDKGLRRRFEVLSLAGVPREHWPAFASAHSSQAAVIITNGKVGCDTELMEALPSLTAIAIHGVGFDRLDLWAARRRGIVVTNTPDALTDDVADLAVGLIIGLLRQIPAADSFVREGRWPQSNFPLATKVSGKRFGILGLGRIGLAIAQRLGAFGSVAYTSRSRKNGPWEFKADAAALAAASDVLIVACAANEQTRGLVDARVIAALGHGGFLINIARGEVVDERALARALDDGRLAGAALDVFLDEPHVSPRLVASSRTVLTPHIASATVETRQAMAETVLANLDAFLAGQPPPDAITA